jgi:hypothetical protein
MSQHAPDPPGSRGSHPRKGPFASFLDWQDHRYDPTYYYEQRFPDFLRKNTLLNGYMWLLLVIGLGGIVAFALGVSPLRILTCMAAVCFAVGVKLALRPPR